MSNSRSVTTNQTGPHTGLIKLLERRKGKTYDAPIKGHTQEMWTQVSAQLKEAKGQLIIDSCCGTGLSTILLAARNPDMLVVGIDRSAHRLDKPSLVEAGLGEVPENALLLRAEVGDFWRLLREHEVEVAHHYLLYPNPYPKSAQLAKRWHGHPSFTDLLASEAPITVRSNWLVYLEEMKIAAETLSERTGSLNEIQVNTPMTLFEKKYAQSGQKLWQLEL